LKPVPIQRKSVFWAVSGEYDDIFCLIKAGGDPLVYLATGNSGASDSLEGWQTFEAHHAKNRRSTGFGSYLGRAPLKKHTP
jgi:hypothetical protein